MNASTQPADHRSTDEGVRPTTDRTGPAGALAMVREGLGALAMVREGLKGFMADGALSLSAALSFYTLLSFAPLLILVIWSSASMGQDLQEDLVTQIGLHIGPEAKTVAESVIENARSRPSLGSLAGLVGIGVSLFAATTVFAQLQQSLNRIWGIQARPGNALWAWLRRRIISMGVIAAVGFVAVVSMLASAMMGLVMTSSGPFWDVFNQLVSATVFAGLFTLLFRYLPDARLPWRDALHGGIVTALLFAIGKAVIGIYLARASVGGAYGAAGSVILLMIWVYYASAIFFFGAEYIQARLNAQGRSIPVSRAAERVAS